uniref:Uncharacterized protein n=1 Tax=Romanomermis culicivorax TaxID=13658 RepID=A0A915KI05_ROMCU
MRIRIGKEMRYLIVSLTPNGSYLELDYKEPKMHFAYEAPFIRSSIDRTRHYTGSRWSNQGK